MLWLASHFTDRANTHTYPIFLFCLFCFMSSPVEQLIKSEVLLTTTYHLLQWLSQIHQGSLARFCSVSLPNQNEFNIQNKRNGHYILLLCGAQDYNQVISHVILSQIFATARNTYCILSDQYTDNSSCFLLW